MQVFGETRVNVHALFEQLRREGDLTLVGAMQDAIWQWPVKSSWVPERHPAASRDPLAGPLAVSYHPSRMP